VFYHIHRRRSTFAAPLASSQRDLKAKSDTQNSVSRVALMLKYRATAIAGSPQNYDASAASSVGASSAGASSIAGSSTKAGDSGATGASASPAQPTMHMHAKAVKRAIGLTTETNFIIFHFLMGLNKPEPRTIRPAPTERFLRISRRKITSRPQELNANENLFNPMLANPFVDLPRNRRD